MLIKIIAVILTAFLLTGCQKSNLNSNDSQSSRSGLQNAAEAPSSASKFSGILQNLDLSGNSEVNLPGVTPPAVGFAAADKELGEGIRVITGRIIPVADKDGKTIVGWRIVGELYNDSQQIFNNGQIIVGIGDRVLLVEPVQPGGFLPVTAGERMVYDTLVGEPFQSDNLTVGVRKADDVNPYLRIDVENISFVKETSLLYKNSDRKKDRGIYNYIKSYIFAPVFAQEASASAAAEGGLDSPSQVSQNNGQTKLIVSGTIRNTASKPVTGLIVRYWVVIGEEVIGIGTWQAAQDVLAPGQTREFSAEVTALTGADKERLESGEVGLSAAGAAKALN